MSANNFEIDENNRVFFDELEEWENWLTLAEERNIDPRLIPVVGNEYIAHKKAKVRILQAMIDLGFNSITLEKQIYQEDPAKSPYSIDVYGEYWPTNRRIGVELDGKVGHTTKQAYHKDVNKKKWIEKQGIILLRLPVSNLDKQMDDETIKAELMQLVLR